MSWECKSCTRKSWYNGNREIALIRDNYSCVKCGMTDDEHKMKYNKSITIDHIDGNGSKSKNPNNSLENLQTLCLSCHCRKERSRSSQYKDRKVVCLDTGEIFDSCKDVRIKFKLKSSTLSDNLYGRTKRVTSCGLQFILIPSEQLKSQLEEENK